MRSICAWTWNSVSMMRGEAEGKNECKITGVKTEWDNTGGFYHSEKTAVEKG